MPDTQDLQIGNAESQVDLLLIFYFKNVFYQICVKFYVYYLQLSNKYAYRKKLLKAKTISKIRSTKKSTRLKLSVIALLIFLSKLTMVEGPGKGKTLFRAFIF